MPGKQITDDEWQEALTRWANELTDLRDNLNSIGGMKNVALPTIGRTMRSLVSKTLQKINTDIRDMTENAQRVTPGDGRTRGGVGATRPVSSTDQ